MTIIITHDHIPALIRSLLQALSLTVQGKKREREKAKKGGRRQVSAEAGEQRKQLYNQTAGVLTPGEFPALMESWTTE